MAELTPYQKCRMMPKPAWTPTDVTTMLRLWDDYFETCGIADNQHVFKIGSVIATCTNQQIRLLLMEYRDSNPTWTAFKTAIMTNLNSTNTKRSREQLCWRKLQDPAAFWQTGEEFSHFRIRFITAWNTYVGAAKDVGENKVGGLVVKSLPNEEKKVATFIKLLGPRMGLVSWIHSKIPLEEKSYDKVVTACEQWLSIGATLQESFPGSTSPAASAIGANPFTTLPLAAATTLKGTPDAQIEQLQSTRFWNPSSIAGFSGGYFPGLQPPTTTPAAATPSSQLEAVTAHFRKEIELLKEAVQRSTSSDPHTSATRVSTSASPPASADGSGFPKTNEALLSKLQSKMDPLNTVPPEYGFQEGVDLCALRVQNKEAKCFLCGGAHFARHCTTRCCRCGARHPFRECTIRHEEAVCSQCGAQGHLSEVCFKHLLKTTVSGRNDDSGSSLPRKRSRDTEGLGDAPPMTAKFLHKLVTTLDEVSKRGREERPGGKGNNRELCRNFQRGHCRRGDNCKYHHGRSGSRPHKRLRTLECFNWRDYGSCKFGDRCNYLHLDPQRRGSAGRYDARDARHDGGGRHGDGRRSN